MRVNRRTLIHLLLLSFLALSAPASITAQSGNYTFVNLDVPGAPVGSTAPYGVNDDAQIVGGYNDSDGTGHGFRCDGCQNKDKGQYVTVDYPGDFTFSTGAAGINNIGMISGSYTGGEGDNYGLHGFVESNGSYTSFDCSSLKVTDGYGINNKGDIVGFYFDVSGQHGFLFSSGVCSRIDYPGAYGTSAVGINDNGQIVGYYGDANGNAHGFFYDGHGDFTKIDHPNGEFETVPNGINNAGLVAGYYCNDMNCTISGSFLWKNGQFTDINYSGVIAVFGINNNEQIVGVYTDASGTPHGFLGTPVGSSYTLTVAITGSGSVTSTDGLINCPGTCSHSYPANTQVTLNATPAQGDIFAGWNGACEGTAPCTLTMTQPLSATAIFSGALQFVAVTPCRLVDTRNTNGEFGGPPLQGNNVRSFPIPDNQDCKIPSSAAAYSLNVTVVPKGPLGYLTVWPTGEDQPLVSTLNSDGRVKANAAIVPAGTNGAVSFYVTDTTNLVLDIDGYFAPVSQTTLAFYPLPPCRAADTRGKNGDLGGPYLKGGIPRDFPVLEATSCNIPSSAVAYSMNFTAVPRGPLQYLTVWPAGQKQPNVSTLNAPTGTVTANAAIVPAGTGGAISTFAYNDTDLIIDIDGYFAPPGQNGLSLYPVVPCRVLDTRNGNGAFNGTLTPPVDVLGSACAPSSASKAYVFNATVVPKGPMGYLTLWPDGIDQPVVSTLNAYDGAITSNMAIVPAGTGGKIDAYADGLTQLILDISSYFAP